MNKNDQKLVTKSMKIILKASPENNATWIALALFIKGLYFVGFIFLVSKPSILGHEHFLGYWGGDTYSYVAPIESFIKNLKYHPDYRMPGYTMPLFFIRVLFNHITSLNILIFLQYIYSSISCYYLARIAQMVFKSNQIFYYTFFLYLTVLSVHLYDGYILTESIHISSTIFFVYFLFKFYQSSQLIQIFISGCFYAHVVFLKPAYLPLFFISIIVLFFRWKAHPDQIKKLLLPFALFILPFFSLDIIWTARNYYTHKKIYFLHNGYEYPKIKQSPRGHLWKFCRDIGKSFTWEDKDALFYWLTADIGSLKTGKMDHMEPPNYIYTSKFNKDSLLKINSYYNSYIRETNDSLKEKYKNYINFNLKLYGDSFKKEKPLHYYVYTPFILFEEYIDTPFTYQNWKIFPFPKNWVMLFLGISYYVVLVFGSLGLICVMLKKTLRNDLPIVLVFISGYSLFLFPFILRLTENRYLAPALPFFVILASFIIALIVKKLTVLIKKQ